MCESAPRVSIALTGNGRGRGTDSRDPGATTFESVNPSLLTHRAQLTGRPILVPGDARILDGRVAMATEFACAGRVRTLACIIGVGVGGKDGGWISDLKQSEENNALMPS